MGRNRDNSRSRRRWLAALGAVVLVCGAPAAGSEDEATVRLMGPKKPKEGILVRYTAVLEGRVPLERGPEGYTPSVLSRPLGGAFVPMEWEPPVEFVWSFGDGTPEVSTGSLPVAAHRFADDTAGEELTVSVAAKTESGWLVTDSRQAVVENRRPSYAEAEAIEIDPASSTFQLTAVAFDAPGDRGDLTYEWDFDDGETGEGQRVDHRYLFPGTYEAKVTIRDGDGGEREETVKVVVGGSGDGGAVDEGPPAADEGLLTGFDGTVDGAFSGPIQAEIRPFAGLFLSTIGGGVCRFLWTGWDSERLAVLTFIADLPYLPEEGARWTLRPEVLQLGFLPDAESWLDSYGAANRSALGLGAAAWAGAAGLAGERGDEEEQLYLEDEAERSEHEGMVNEALEAAGAGVQVGTRERQRFAGTPVAVSPFGVSGSPGFEAQGGTVELSIVPHEYAKAELRGVTLVGEDEDGNERSVSLDGTFVLDLEAAPRDGLVRYDRCAPRPTLAIEEVRPADGRRHLDRHEQWVDVDFDRDYDPETLDETTFQLTYRPPEGEPVVVPAFLLRSRRSARLYPKEPLRSGVRYTARVKTGEDGVKGPGGSQLEDPNGRGWSTWDFWTRVDLESTPDGSTRFGCHTFQSVRDAPLIAGKRAVTRLYADWKADPEVHEEDQVEAIAGRIAWRPGGMLGEPTAETTHTFLRTDLRSEEQERQAGHTANLFWTPDEDQEKFGFVLLDLPELHNSPGMAAPADYYQTFCPTPMWDLAPRVTITHYVLAINSWQIEGTAREIEARVEALAPRIRDYAEQVFPFQRVELRYGGILRTPEDPEVRRMLRVRSHETVRAIPPEVFDIYEEDPALESLGVDEAPSVCANALTNGGEQDSCPERFLRLLGDDERTDVLVGWQPGSGGGAVQMIGENNGLPEASGKGVIRLGLPPEEEFHPDRSVMSFVHETGHTLHLDHLPLIQGDDELGPRERADLRDLLYDAWANERQPIHWYEGIEGFRIEPSGTEGHNKSSSEGNGESDWMVPLMYPIAVHVPDAWITRHHYLDVMELIEENRSTFE